jgi:cell division protein FtsL
MEILILMAVVFFFLPIVLSILAYRKSNEVNDQVVRLRSLIEDKGNQKDPSYSNSINQVDQQQNSTQDLTSKSPEYSQNQENITDNSINEQQVAEKDFLEVFFI